MRVIYIKKNAKIVNGFNSYWKVKETEEGVCILDVQDDRISIEENDDYFEEVSFIMNTLCKDDGYTEITKNEFDQYFNKVISEINKILNL